MIRSPSVSSISCLLSSTQWKKAECWHLLGRIQRTQPPLLTLRTPEIDAKEAELNSKLEAARVLWQMLNDDCLSSCRPGKRTLPNTWTPSHSGFSRMPWKCSLPGAAHSFAWQTDHGWRVVRTRRTIPIRSAFPLSLLLSPGCCSMSFRILRCRHKALDEDSTATSC